MEISRENFIQAALKTGIPKNKIEEIWSILEMQESKTSLVAKWLFYFGAMIVIGAMFWLIIVNWNDWGGGEIILISILYGLFFTLVGAKLWDKPDLKIPGGIFITLAVCMVPLAVYGIETYLNIWPKELHQLGSDNFILRLKESWLFMELATIAAGLIALKFFPFAFITAPIFVSCLLLATITIPELLGRHLTYEHSQWIVLLFGLMMLMIAYGIDRKGKRDFAFWGYVFGTMTFWIALTQLIWPRSEGMYFVFFLINVVMMIFSILLKQKVLMIFGAIGAFLYLEHLMDIVLKDSILFPLAMSLVGIFIIFLGVIYQKNAKQIENKLLGILPNWIKHLLP